MPDFDGVLHRRGGAPGQMLPFEWNVWLAELLEPFDEVMLVVISSWREAYPEDYLVDFLAPMSHRFLAAVGPGPKRPAIEAFLAARPDITEVLVLEDEPAAVLGLEASAQVTVIACNPLQGVSDPEVRRRIQSWLKATT